jgi:hypothetical protein
VSDLIRHVVNIKTQVTVLVMQAQSSKQQGCLQHQKLLHKLVMTHVINLIRPKQKNGQAIRNKEILSFTTPDKMTPRSIGLGGTAEHMLQGH